MNIELERRSLSKERSVIARFVLTWTKDENPGWGLSSHTFILSQMATTIFGFLAQVF